MRAVFSTREWADWRHLCGAPAREGADETAATDETDQEALSTATALPAGTPLLCTVSKSGTLGTKPITGDGLHVMVKRRAEFAGIPGPIGFHSLSIGPESLIAACPTSGWPTGFHGRRDAFLIVLTRVLGYSATQARQLRTEDIDPAPPAPTARRGRV